jgi:hypothetical protein
LGATVVARIDLDELIVLRLVGRDRSGHWELLLRAARD